MPGWAQLEGQRLLTLVEMTGDRRECRVNAGIATIPEGPFLPATTPVAPGARGDPLLSPDTVISVNQIRLEFLTSSVALYDACFTVS